MAETNKWINKVHTGNVLSILKEMPCGFIDCLVTSPPFYALRDYKTELQVWDGNPDCDHQWSSFTRKGMPCGTRSEKVQIKGKDDFQIVPDGSQGTCVKCGASLCSLGLEPSIDLYIKHLCDIFDEVKRVLKDSGCIFVNLGDSYGGSHSGKIEDSKAAQKGTGATTLGMARPTEKETAKCLCLIPQRFVLEMADRGWICRNEIIWHKPNAMCSSVKDRFTVNFEYVFFFTKKQKYFFNQQFEKFADATFTRLDQKSFDTQTGGDKDYGKTKVNLNMQARKTIENLKKSISSKEGRNKRCVWEINTQACADAHFAVFPPEIPKICISAGCPKDGITLDPFAGTGTTLVEAIKQNKRYVGIELNPQYVIDFINRNIAKTTGQSYKTTNQKKEEVENLFDNLL